MPVTLPVHQRRLAVALPVKPFREAKRRLAPLFDDHERAAFARVMFLDVLTTVCEALAPQDVFVVTADDEAAKLAGHVNAQLIRESAPAGMTAALALAASQLALQGYDSMLTLPIDVPLITGADIARILAGQRGPPSVTLVPAADGEGTNAMCCTPLDSIPFCFGENSFSRHCEGARARGFYAQVMRLERVGLDLDFPRDVAAFLQYPTSTRSRAYLRALGVDGRLGADAAASRCPAPAQRSSIVADEGRLP